MKTKVIIITSAALLAFAAVKHHSGNGCPLKSVIGKEVRK